MWRIVLKMSIFLGLLLTSSFLYAREDIKDITFITEVYPPYNFATKDGVPTGIFVDILELALTNMGIQKARNQFYVRPWPIGYALAQTPGKQNSLFAIARTKSREGLFKWVGPIVPSNVAIFCKKTSAIKISSETELNNYTYSVIRGDIGGIKVA